MKAFEEMAEKGHFTKEGRNKEMGILVEDIRKNGREPPKHLTDYYIPSFIAAERFYPTITSDRLIIGSARKIDFHNYRRTFKVFSSNTFAFRKDTDN